MKKVKGMKYCFIAAAIAILAVFVAAPVGAWDLNWKLRGDYTYNVAATCAHAVCGINPDTSKYDCQDPSTRGFNPATLALRVPGSQKSYSYNVQGVIHFDGHGNFTLKGEILTIRTTVGINLPDIPANQYDLDVAGGTYKVDSAGNGLFVDIIFPNYTVTVKSGAYTGMVIKSSGDITLRGRLDTATGSSTVILSQTIPEIEEMEVIVPTLGMNEQRICNLTGSIVQLSPRRNWLLNK